MVRPGREEAPGFAPLLWGGKYVSSGGWGEQWGAGGSVRVVEDEVLQGPCVDVMGDKIEPNSITCPARAGSSLRCALPYLVMVIKNQDAYFAFEVQVLDSAGVVRRFRVSNAQSLLRKKELVCSMPIRLAPGWNYLAYNLADWVRAAYGTSFVEVQRVTLYANCRIRRIHLGASVMDEEDLPHGYRIYDGLTHAEDARPTVEDEHDATRARGEVLV